jgi:Uma2 family endonuclease
MVVQPKGERRYTVEEYLEMDRESDEKLEYVDGQIIAMTGASRNHNVIAGNVLTLFNTLLRDAPCIASPGDMRVRVEDSAVHYRYPDVTVVCGEERYTDENPPSLLNPTLIVEVLFPSTQATDRGPKVDEYQRIPSLQVYLMVAQDRPWVVALVRNSEGRWWYETVEDMGAKVVLPNPACELPLTEVYRKVSW